MNKVREFISDNRLALGMVALLAACLIGSVMWFCGVWPGGGFQGPSNDEAPATQQAKAGKRAKLMFCVPLSGTEEPKFAFAAGLQFEDLIFKPTFDGKLFCAKPEYRKAYVQTVAKLVPANSSARQAPYIQVRYFGRTTEGGGDFIWTRLQKETDSNGDSSYPFTLVTPERDTDKVIVPLDVPEGYDLY